MHEAVATGDVGVEVDGDVVVAEAEGLEAAEEDIEAVEDFVPETIVAVISVQSLVETPHRGIA